MLRCSFVLMASCDLVLKRFQYGCGCTVGHDPERHCIAHLEPGCRCILGGWNRWCDNEQPCLGESCGTNRHTLNVGIIAFEGVNEKTLYS